MKKRRTTDGLGSTFRGTCKGTTKAGKPCKRAVVFANGYCLAHGGDSREYEKERFERIKAKAIRRAERWQRKSERRKREAEQMQGQLLESGT